MRIPPLQRVLIFNLLLATLLAGTLLFVAIQIVSSAAENAARAGIAAESSALARRYAELNILSFAAEIEQRVEEQAAARTDQNVYLLQRSDGTKAAGNIDRWPAGTAVTPGSLRFDGSAAGIRSGRIIAEVAVVDDRFPLLVGRRLEPVDSLMRRYLPAALALLAAFLAVATGGTLWIDRTYRRRIAATNSVFDGLRSGDLAQRVPDVVVAAGDELGALAANINRALADIERLVKGLDASSQSAAHELNRELSRLRVQARNLGHAPFVAATDQMIELLRELLSLTKIRSGTAFDSRPVSIDALIANAVDPYRDAASHAHVALEVDALRAKGVSIRGVESQLRSALMNLIENALKHSPADSSVRVLAEADAHAVTIHVADQGPGAASEDLSELIAAGSQSAVPGNGLGLRLVQAVAIRHGATVALRNTAPGLQITLRFLRA